MRSDAKASTAGSKQRQSLSGLGRTLRGALAGRASSPGSDGSGASSARRLALPAGVLAAILALVVLAGSAFGANGVVNFFGGTGTEGGLFSSSSGGPGGIAVNQAGTGGATAGDVYVVDRGNRRVQQFEADGTWVRAFGEDVGGAGVDVCEVAASCVQATASAEAGSMNTPQGIAIDQPTGNVFVTDQSNRRIDVFSAEGAFEGAFGWGVDSGAAELEFCTTASTCQAGSSGANAGQLGTSVGYPAVAPAGSPNAGDLYVADKSNRRVDEFAPELTGEEVTGVAFVKAWGWGVDTGAAEFEQCTTASLCQSPNTSSPTTNPGQFSSNQPSALAVDSNGNLYTAESAGNNRAQKFDSTGNPAPFSGEALAGSPGPIDLAVDPTTDHLFGLKQAEGGSEKRVLELNSAGALLATHASGTTISSANSLAVVNGTTNFYVSSSQSFEYRGVFFLGTKVNPTATTSAPSPLTSHTATLQGEVNPKGFTTRYRFEFSADNGSTWTKYPAQENQEEKLTGEAAIPVSQEVSGLIGGHEYRYRIVATKPFGAGTATSNTTTFTAPASAPEILATYVSAVTPNTAVLNAEINPENEASTYHFEWGTADCAVNPCTSVPVPDAGIGSGETPVKVAKEISGLEPGATYHFRVLATNGTGTTEGPDTVVRTFPELVANTDCPNQVFRSGGAAKLPDCRAYEMVSPVDKEGQDVYAASEHFRVTEPFAPPNQSAVDGDKFAYASFRAFGDQGGAAGFSQYLARRGADGWLSEGLNPPAEDGAYFANLGNPESVAFSPDLTTSWVKPTSHPRLAPDAPEGVPALYRRDLETGAYTTVSSAEPNEAGEWLIEYFGASEGGSYAAFGVNDKLTPEAAPGLTALAQQQAYIWHEGELHAIGILPNGETNPLETVVGGMTSEFIGKNGEEGNPVNAISDDGSRIFWTANEHPSGTPGGPVYMREHAEQGKVAGECTTPDKACTVAISESVAPGNAMFWTAAADGSKALFSVGDNFKPSGGTGVLNLHLFDVETESATKIAGEGLGVAGASEDLSRIYFVSEEDLAAGATAGEPNFYLWDEGTVLFIGPLSEADASNRSIDYSVTRKMPTHRRAYVTPDGRHVAFVAESPELAEQVGYDNTDLNSGKPAAEVYLYEAGGELTCVSCKPSGARPEAKMEEETYADLPTAAWILPYRLEYYANRHVSDDGSRVFFNAHDALVPQDVNGAQDVYEWEAEGTGDCSKPSGCISLLSSGQDKEESTFLDASANGSDVFIRTESSLVPQDPGSWDVYDVRAGGGFPPPAPETAGCEGEACQNPPAAPQFANPASAAFRGAGNPVPARDCGAQARRAIKLSHRAKRLRRAAKRQARRQANPRRIRRMRRQARGFAKRAHRLSVTAKRCRRANRRAGR